MLEAPPGARIALGIGDDAAAWRPSRSNLSVITTDALIEDVHFTRARFSMREIGHRALACNLSDIAAMGARPVLATVALGVPAGANPQDVVDIYRGMNALARGAKTAIVGGDLVRSDKLMLSITVVGEVRPGNLKRRSGARPGDVLAVTGELGASRAGLDGSASAQARAKHCTPEPRLREGRWFGASASIHAMMDLSDGIAMDVPRMARASMVAVEIQALPIAPSAAQMAQAHGEDPLRYTLAAGEDLELLVAVAPRAFAHLAGRFEQRFGYALTRVGQFREGSGASVRDGQNVEPLPVTGWDHLGQ